MKLCGGESIKRFVIDWINGHKLALKMRRKFGYFNTCVGSYACDFIAISLAFGSFLKIKEARVKCWDLNTLIAESSSPIGYFT
jgi:hypothetical protein